MPESPTSEPETTFVCDCDESVRSVCAGELFYQEHEGKEYCVLHFPGHDKTADFNKAFQRKLDNRDFNFQGVWFPNGISFRNFQFTLEANFSSATFRGESDFSFATFAAEANFSETKFRGTAKFGLTRFSAAVKFESATFTMVSFFNATFSAETNFSAVTFADVTNFTLANFSGEALFSGATFIARAMFVRATFSRGADFSSVTFGAWACFSYAEFNGTGNFSLTTFSAEADFGVANFGTDVNFAYATFTGMANFKDTALSAGATFTRAIFSNYVEFRPVFNDASSLDFEFARIEAADRVSFHTLTLRPNWFVNVDARKFDFTNVEWDWRTIDKEIKSLQKREVPSPHRLLAIACRHLAVNAEENHRYEEASKFRYMAMDVRRREKWRGFVPWRLGWWYWLASGYGERVGQAFFVLLGILLLSALLYNQVGFARWEPKVASESDAIVEKRDDVGAPLKFSRALTYSAGVMTFQKPEPRPATTAAQTVVLLETVLGPVQAALLALAIRRKFMR
jgi:hypothetical protein